MILEPVLKFYNGQRKDTLEEVRGAGIVQGKGFVELKGFVSYSVLNQKCLVSYNGKCAELRV